MEFDLKHCNEPSNRQGEHVLQSIRSFLSSKIFDDARQVQLPVPSGRAPSKPVIRESAQPSTSSSQFPARQQQDNPTSQQAALNNAWGSRPWHAPLQGAEQPSFHTFTPRPAFASSGLHPANTGNILEGVASGFSSVTLKASQLLSTCSPATQLLHAQCSSCSQAAAANGQQTSKQQEEETAESDGSSEPTTGPEQPAPHAGEAPASAASESRQASSSHMDQSKSRHWSHFSHALPFSCLASHWPAISSLQGRHQQGHMSAWGAGHANIRAMHTYLQRASTHLLAQSTREHISTSTSMRENATGTLKGTLVASTCGCSADSVGSGSGQQHAGFQRHDGQEQPPHAVSDSRGGAPGCSTQAGAASGTEGAAAGPLLSEADQRRCFKALLQEVLALRRERQHLGSQLADVQAHNGELLEENSRLRAGTGGEQLDEAVWKQVEVLLKEKARLAEENSRIVNENRNLHMLLAFAAEQCAPEQWFPDHFAPEDLDLEHLQLEHWAPDHPWTHTSP